MKRIIAYLALAVAAVVGIGAADGRDAEPAGRSARRARSSTLAFTVSTRDFPGGEQTAARTLMAVCAATVDDATITVPAQAREADDAATVRGT